LTHKFLGYQLQVSSERVTRNLLPMSLTSRSFWPMWARRRSPKKQGAVELLTPRLDQSAAETIAEKLTGGLPQSATPLSVPKDAAEQFLR
jgi:hypothetical protein